MRSLLVSIILLIMTVSVYWQVGGHSFLNYDDTDYVTENPHVARGLTSENITWAFTSTDAANWHPITWLSHMADVQIYGMDPRGHHLTNVIIHAISSVLLFLLLFRMTGSCWPSAFVAALFALHPLHVESVAWVAERKDLLSAFFGFITLFFYVWYVATHKIRLYLFAVFAFVLGLMSKPMLVTLPLVMLLIDFWPLGRYRQGADSSGRLVALVKEKIPFFLGSLCSAIITLYAQSRGGALSNLEGLPVGSRLQNAMTAYVRYIYKTLWPHDLAVLYPIPAAIPLWQVIGSLLVLIIISVVVIRFRRLYPYLAVGWFWFMVTLLPVIGLIQVGSQSIADRYSYIPLIGLFIIVAWGVSASMKHVPFRQIILAVAAGVVIATSALLTWQQLRFWRDDISLYRHALDVTTGNFLMHNQLGIMYRYRGDLDGAIREYQTAIAAEPRYAEAHNNLGIALAKKGEPEAAIREFKGALALNHRYAQAHNNLGVTLASIGDLDGAIAEYQATLAIKPDDPQAITNLENAIRKRGK